MNLKRIHTSTGVRGVLLILCAAVLAAGNTLAQVAAAQSAGGAPDAGVALIPPDQLDSLVAPIALYPDPLLAQVLAAATYPLEIIQLQQWLTKNPGLKDQALADALLKQPWDPSVEALAATPDLVKRLADDIQWTTDLGNAFLAQQSDVMDAVQRMRKTAMDKNALKTTEQQVVQTKVVETKTVVIIEPANPQVVYVPTYSPVVVWGPPIYPYPPIYYPPPPPPGYYALSFGIGVAMGYWWGGGGGYNCGWGRSSYVSVNYNNTYIRNVNNININNGNRINNGPANGNNRWQHKPEHRGGAPYRDRATADRYGGATRGDSLANRQSNARDQVNRQGGNLSSSRPSGGGSAGAANRPGGAGGGSAGAANRPGGAGGGNAGAANRPGGAGGGNAGAANRPGGAGGGNAGAANRPGGAGGASGDRVGNRNLSSGGAGGGDRNAFGSGSGYNGAGARASSNRGAASVQSRGGGNARAGGGGGARRK